MEEPFAVSTVTIGLYNGTTTLRHGRLLYKTLLNTASSYSLLHALVIQPTQGSQSGQRFRSIENEVSSNELPMVLRFTGEHESIQEFSYRSVEHVNDDGIVVVDTAVKWWRPRNWLRERKLRAIASSTENPASVHRPSPGLEVQICITEGEQADHRPIHQMVADYLRRQDIAWVSTTKGVGGFGEQGMYRNKWWGRGDVPVMILAIDRVERLEPLLSDLGRMVGSHGVVTSRTITLLTQRFAEVTD